MDIEFPECTECGEPTPAADLQQWAEKFLCPKCWEEWGDFPSSRSDD